jgi:hypothetical protein
MCVVGASWVIIHIAFASSYLGRAANHKAVGQGHNEEYEKGARACISSSYVPSGAELCFWCISDA